MPRRRKGGRSGALFAESGGFKNARSVFVFGVFLIRCSLFGCCTLTTEQVKRFKYNLSILRRPKKDGEETSVSKTDRAKND